MSAIINVTTFKYWFTLWHAEIELTLVVDFQPGSRITQHTELTFEMDFQRPVAYPHED